MRLNKFCEIARHCWLDIPAHFPRAELDAFVVMPNHVHGVIVIVDGRGTPCRAPTERFGRPVTGSIPAVIRSFKSAVTKHINEQRSTPGAQIWQRNYYEHIIRDEVSLNRIRQYIVDNPLRWDLDRENPEIVGADFKPAPTKDEPWCT
ncbi:hypothetical protein HRbin30_01660 [bacterium HR30]|nr:hypothetical protein HRbin30_01660 [bacterium HR30]